MNDIEKARPASTAAIALALALVYVVWGSTYLAIHYAVQTMPPFIMASMRFLFGGIILYGFLRLRGVPAPTRCEWISSLVVGTLLLGGGNGGVVWAQRTVPSGLAALLVSVIPLWMTLFEWWLPGGKRPTALAAVGLLFGFIGLYVLIGFHAEGMHVNVALMALLLAPISWAFGSVISKRLQVPSSPFMSTAAQMLSGFVVLAVFALLDGEFNGFHPRQVSAVSWWGLIYLTLIGGLIGFTAYVWLLKNAPLPLVSTYAYVNPLVAVLLGWLFVGETLSGRTAVAGALILASVAITALSKDRKS